MVTVSRAALMELLDELLTVPSADPPISANPMASVEDVAGPKDLPVDDPGFTPSNAIELAAAADKLVRRIPDDEIPKFYSSLKRLTTIATGETMDEAVRMEVRRLIEMMPDQADLDADEEEELEKKRSYRSVSDVEGTTLQQIAGELGFASPRGAMAFVDRAIEKFKFLWQAKNDPDFQVTVLEAVRDYIDFLSTSGELDAEDVALLHDNPMLVAELDGFREFLHTYVKRLMKKG